MSDLLTDDEDYSTRNHLYDIRDTGRRALSSTGNEIELSSIQSGTVEYVPLGTSEYSSTGNGISLDANDSVCVD